MTETIEAIVDAIRSAFADVQRGAITLHEAEALDRYEDDDERARARRRDTETSWEEIPDEDIEQCEAALAHLDPVSWRYYIAAYMTWSLQNYRTSESSVPDFTIYNFFHNDAERPGAIYIERFRLLTPAQSHAVYRFLRYMANEDYVDGDTARRALEQTWEHFADQDGST